MGIIATITLYKNCKANLLSLKGVGLLCLFVLVLVSCTKELDLDLPRDEPQIVLNSLLHPDSTIQISLTTTTPLNSESNNFPIIDNAIVQLYEDGAMVGSLEFQGSLYVLDYYPKPGSEYTVEAEVPGYPTVWASDIIPNAPTIEVCYREDTAQQYMYADAIFKVDIDDPVQETNFYWLDIVRTFPESPRCRIKEDSIVIENGEIHVIPQDTIVCNDNGPPTFEKSRGFYYESFSSIPDRFNSFVDNTTGGVTIYEGYVRVEDAAINGEMIAFELAAGSYGFLARYPRIHDQLAAMVTITNASQHYDRYLKSSVIYLLNREYSEDEDTGFKPFVEASQVYSNVENGIGIFAAFNSVSIDVGDYLCE